MLLVDSIEQDLKAALLSKDAVRVETLRSMKNALLYAEVGQGKERKSLSETEKIEVLIKESKKRQESADLYQQANESTRTQKELAEKAIIEKYLPKRLSEAEIEQLIDKALEQFGTDSQQSIGQVIAAVRQLADGIVDGATVARLVKEKLQ
ncbi:MAG TPA: GatB/YqeY domain-containing protein [Candidatus Saccharimonadales bacterium]|jgi:hypothetical protein|nr:GatB/YqeY domain-containing protein [Candidatus Saccharimonadales bacterium]